MGGHLCERMCIFRDGEPEAENRKDVCLGFTAPVDLEKRHRQ